MARSSSEVELRAELTRLGLNTPDIENIMTFRKERLCRAVIPKKGLSDAIIDHRSDGVSSTFTLMRCWE